MLDMELEGAVGIIGLGTFKVRLGAFCIMRWPKLFLEVSEIGDGTLTEEMDYKRAVINDCISVPF